MGINVMKLLQGAKAMNEHFRSAKASDNIVLQYTAVNHLIEKHRGANIRLLSVWSSSLSRLECGTTNCWPRVSASSNWVQRL
ncbi:MAG: hypothetical protein U0930_19345 [Pirellulales bacterium]